MVLKLFIQGGTIHDTLLLCPEIFNYNNNKCDLMFISGLITCEQGLDNYLVHYVTEYGRIVARSKMSIFFKFVVESGEPQSVKCGGMDMSLADLKLAIKDQRRFKNVTDFDLQVNIILLYLMSI